VVDFALANGMKVKGHTLVDRYETFTRDSNDKTFAEVRAARAPASILGLLTRHAARFSHAPLVERARPETAKLDVRFG
jgi:hypothetical protein